MKKERFTRWIKQIHRTEKAEIECDRLQKLLPAFIDAEVTGALIAAEIVEIQIHLAQCSDCMGDYEGLRQIALLEINGELPEAATLLALLAPENTAVPQPKSVESLPVIAP